MKHENQELRKILQNFLIEKNELKSSTPETEPEYEKKAAKCHFSIIPVELPRSPTEYIVTVVWDIRSIGDYDVLILRGRVLDLIFRSRCCRKHCDTWSDTTAKMNEEYWVPFK